MYVIMVCGMFVWCSLCVGVCILTESNALLMSSATVIVRSGGLFWLKPVAMVLFRLQTTQPLSGGAVTAVTNCCANCVEPSRFSVFWASQPCGPAGWLALLLTKADGSRLIQVRQH